jgi:hypothetical protein
MCNIRRLSKPLNRKGSRDEVNSDLNLNSPKNHTKFKWFFLKAKHVHVELLNNVYIGKGKSGCKRQPTLRRKNGSEEPIVFID